MKDTFCIPNFISYLKVPYSQSTSPLLASASDFPGSPAFVSEELEKCSQQSCRRIYLPTDGLSF